jgi:hypothetical protein
MAGTKISGGTAGWTRVSRSNGFHWKTGGDALSTSAREGFVPVETASSRIYYPSLAHAGQLLKARVSDTLRCREVSVTNLEIFVDKTLSLAVWK